MTRTLGAIVLAVVALSAVAAHAAGPEDLVRWIYTSLSQPGSPQSKGLAFVTSAAERDRYLSRRLAGFYAAEDSYRGADPFLACITSNPAIPSRSYNAAEIARSVKVSASGDSAHRNVTARFTVYGAPASVTFRFIPEGGTWRLDDIVSNGQKLADTPCFRRPSSAQLASGAILPGGEYCFSRGATTFRIMVSGSGRARYALDEWTDSGASCSAGGIANPFAHGWVETHATSAGPCTIRITLTPGGGLRLSDKDGICRETQCGNAAAIDGLKFDRSARVACASLPKTEN